MPRNYIKIQNFKKILYPPPYYYKKVSNLNLKFKILTYNYKN